MSKRASQSTSQPRHSFCLQILLVLLILLAGCGRAEDSESQTQQSASIPTEIEWFEGEVEDAFALAKAEGKPLFLYWGAEWCPPCHYLKRKIFTRSEFIARMQDFVPVYLDGDTARAQILGEKLDVKGYPTVLVFDPMGQEVMRMPSTVPVDQYEAILDTAIGEMKPIKVVLDDVLAQGPAVAAPKDLHLLAFYSWDQESGVDLALEEETLIFGRLYEETPPDLAVERSRFLGLYLVSLAREAQGSEVDEGVLAEPERDAVQEIVLATLADPRLRNANLLWIDYYADSIIELLQPEESPGRHELLGAWLMAAKEMEQDDSLSVDDRLTATSLRLELIEMSAHPDAGETTVPADLQDHVRARVSWALETVTDESELQTVVNTVAHLLRDAGLNDEAESILKAKMYDTTAPYYFMSWIASLRLEAGDDAGALEWYRKAYESAVGRYSRFRWGSSYLRQLMKLSPDDVERIETDSLEVLTELLSHEDAFAGGNHARLDSLQAAYWSWNENGAHDAELTKIRNHVLATCDRYPATGEDSQRQRCESFLSPEEVQGDAAM